MWTWIDHLKDLFALLAVIIGLAVFAYWWLLNRSRRWWIWGIFFWPPQVTKDFVQTGSGCEVLSSVRFVIVNYGLVPEVITEAKLKLEQPGGAKFEFDPYVFMEADAFVKSGESWEAKHKEFFRPFLVKPRSEEACHLLFVPVGKNARDFTVLPPGRYKASLELTRSGGKSKPLGFEFDLKEASDFFGLLYRDITVTGGGKPAPVHQVEAR